MQATECKRRDEQGRTSSLASLTMVWNRLVRSRIHGAIRFEVNHVTCFGVGQVKR
jgi:hypothetical protein